LSCNRNLGICLFLLLTWQVASSLSLLDFSNWQFSFKQHHQSQLSTASKSSLRIVETNSSDMDGDGPRRLLANLIFVILCLTLKFICQTFGACYRHQFLPATTPIWLVNGAILR